jgi:hypothetical protein
VIRCRDLGELEVAEVRWVLGHPLNQNSANVCRLPGVGGSSASFAFGWTSVVRRPASLPLRRPAESHPLVAVPRPAVPVVPVAGKLRGCRPPCVPPRVQTRVQIAHEPAGSKPVGGGAGGELGGDGGGRRWRRGAGVRGDLPADPSW